MSYLESCLDYEILKKELDSKILQKLEQILNNYEDYISKNDDGYKDIIGEYCSFYGNDYVIDWYEGLIDTKEFLEHIKEM